MTEKPFLEIFEDLVDSLDELNKNVAHIATSLSMLEDVLGPAPLLGTDDIYLRVNIVNESDDPVNVEIMPVEDD